MKSLKVLIVSLILIGGMSFYLGGCAPAETTTGKLAYQQKDWEKAEKELSKGLAIDKNDAEAWFMLGYSQIELGKFELAEKSFEQLKSISKDFDNKLLIFYVDKFNAGINDMNSGIKSYNQKDTVSSKRLFNDALKSFTAAKTIMPDSITAFQYMADSYNLLGQNDKALIIYENILDKSKSKDDAINIAKILNNMGNDERSKAFEITERISNLSGENDSVKNLKDIYGKDALRRWGNVETIYKKISEINYLPKDSKYYEAALYNTGLANFQKVSVIFSTNSKEDYKNYLNESIKYLTLLTNTTKDKASLKNSYELLLTCYETLKNDAKVEEIKAKLKEF